MFVGFARGKARVALMGGYSKIEKVESRTNCQFVLLVSLLKFIHSRNSMTALVFGKIERIAK